MACNCCDQPIGGILEFVAKYSSAQKTEDWCGFKSFTGPLKRYERQRARNERIYDAHSGVTIDWTGPPWNGPIEHRTYDIDLLETEERDLYIEDCVTKETPYIRYSLVTQNSTVDDPSADPENCACERVTENNVVISNNCTPGCSLGIAYHSLVLTPDPIPVTPTVSYGSSYLITVAAPSNTARETYFAYGGGHSRAWSELMDEVAKPDIREIVIDALPEPQESVQVISVTNPLSMRSVPSSYTENEQEISSNRDRFSAMAQKASVRFRHGPTATCYLKAWFKECFYPADWGGDYDKVEEKRSWQYEWEQTGNPCFQNPGNSPGHVDNRIWDIEYDIDIPEEEGETRIELIKFSIFPGYVPDDPTLDGSRPVPDINPNGLPA